MAPTTQQNERKPEVLKVLITDCGCGCGGFACSSHQPRVEPPRLQQTCDGECGCKLENS